MKKYILHQWLPLLIALVIFTGCSKKNYPSNNNTNTESQYDNTKAPNNDYTPPQVVSVSDDQAKTNKDGEMYYDNELGYRYWRFCDGKYYLDAKYESGASPNKKLAKKKTKNKAIKERNQNNPEDFINQ